MMLALVMAAGLTAEMAAESARQKSWDVQARSGVLKSAQGRTDAALVDFFPRVQGVARYSRLSPIDQPSLVDIPGFADVKFPVILDNWLFQLGASLPVSDYLFRIVQSYRGYVSQASAARLEQQAASRKAAADARLAFYAWAKSLVQRQVAEQSRALAQENLNDAGRLFAVGRSSQADVLQLRSRLASAQLAEQQSEQAVLVALEQLRRTARLEDSASLELGEDLSEPLAAVNFDDAAVLSEALEKRPELAAVAATRAGLSQSVSAARALYYPRLEAFANLVYANPNQRFIPQTQTFKLTWEAGAQLVWTFNDSFQAIGRVREAEGRLEELDAQLGRVSDTLHVEVRTVLCEVRNADAGVISADTAFSAANESFRVRRELFRSGRATSTELLTAEVDVARAKLSAAIARIDQRQSRARLDYAIGR